MWQLLQALWGKIAGKAPPVPPAARTGKAPQTSPVKMPPQSSSTRPAEASQPTLEPSTPAVAGQNGEPAVLISSQEQSPNSSAVEFPLGTSTAKSIGSFWAMADTGSRISCIASATDSGRAVSSISRKRAGFPTVYTVGRDSA